MKSFKRGIAIAIGVASLGALAASGETSGSSGSSGGNSSSSGKDAHPPADDVTIAKCYTDDLGSPQADIAILNHSSKPSNYIVNVAFESADGMTQIDTSMVAVNDLQPGQSSTQQAVSFGSANGDFKCKVTDVTRYASGG